MSSFISSFKREIKVVVALAAVLLLVEVGMRRSAPRISIDLATIFSYPNTANAIKSANQAGKKTVLFQGGSLVRTDVLLPVVRERTSNSNLEYFKCMADATSLTEWYYTFKRYFVRTNCKPDVLFICMSKDALEDDFGFEPRRLGRHFAATADFPELLSLDLDRFDDRFCALAAKASSLFANRERIQLRLLSMIPHYEKTVQKMNLAARPKGKAVAAGEYIPKYTRLERLLDVAESEGVKLYIVAMGMPTHYKIADPLAQLLAKRGIELVDLREIEGVQPEMFPDGVHMNEEAAKLLSVDLAEAINNLGL